MYVFPLAGESQPAEKKTIPLVGVCPQVRARFCDISLEIEQPTQVKNIAKNNTQPNSQARNLGIFPCLQARCQFASRDDDDDDDETLLGTTWPGWDEPSAPPYIHVIP